MFRILPRFGKIGVGIFENRVLIAMPNLFLQANVAGALVILGLGGAFCRILIACAIQH